MKLLAQLPWLQIALIAGMAGGLATAVHAYEPTSHYELRHLAGWQVYIHRDLLPGGKQADTGVGAIRQLKYGLAKVRQMLAQPALSNLMAVKIWLEVDSTHGPHGPTAGYQYHPDLDWLVKMDFNPQKQKCVEYGNAASLAKRTDLKTATVTMHELAHAYHDQVLGFDNPDVMAAHQRARENGKYPEKDWVVRADHKEFFAGLVTRYYGDAEQRQALLDRDPVFAGKLVDYFGAPKAFLDTPIAASRAGAHPRADASSTFTLQDDTRRGRLHVKEGKHSILTYNYGMQLNTGAEEKYERGCYIHPLWDANGWQRTLTEDFPPLDGHLHHRGLGWVWPYVRVRGQQVQTWHPSDPPLRQHFVRWLKREANDQHAILAVENAWLLDDKEPVMTETVELVMHPLQSITMVKEEKEKSKPWELNARAIDLTLTFNPVGGPIELKGGYGGLLLRGSADMKEGVITTNEGPLDGDSQGAAFQWADLTCQGRGVAIFPHPNHPPHPKDPGRSNRPLTPPRWLLRTSYAGLMNVAWPGPRPVTIEPGKPITLQYRLYVHEGDAARAEVGKAFDAYVRQMQPGPH